MRSIKLLLLCIAIGLTTTDFSCQKQTDDYHSYYTLNNKTTAAVYSAWSFDSAMVGSEYPPALSPPTFKCEANSSRNYGYRGSSFEYNLNNPPASHLYIYVFDAGVLETTQWDTVRKYHMYLARYQYSKTQMDSLNWTINFL